MRRNCLELVIREAGAEPHLDRTRENAEKKRRKGGSPERKCQLKPGAGVVESLGGPVSPWWALPQVLQCGPGAGAHTSLWAGSIPSSCGTTLQRNEPRVSTSSSCLRAPRPGSPHCIRAIVSDMHLQLSLAPMRTQLGCESNRAPSIYPNFSCVDIC